MKSVLQKEDYLEKRRVSEFLAWIDTINKKRLINGESVAYRDRSGLWKKYADEAEPLARYLRANQMINIDARVTLTLDTDEGDAFLEFNETIIQFEITTTDNPSAVYGRRQLNSYGIGPGDTNTVSTGKDLAIRKALGNKQDFGEIKNSTHMEREEIGRLIDRINKKASKHYPSGTTLIVDSCSSSLDQTQTNDLKSILLKNSIKRNSFSEIWINFYPGRLLQYK